MKYSKIRKLCMNSKLHIVKEVYRDSVSLNKNPTDKYLIEEIEYLLEYYKKYFSTVLLPIWTEKEFKQTEKFIEKLKSML